jgi:hypothetical protein
VPEAHRVEVAGSGREEQLKAIDGALGALVLDASAQAPIEPSRLPPPPAHGDREAVIAHVERLGEMRNQGLLSAAEFETLKEQAMRMLETAS